MLLGDGGRRMLAFNRYANAKTRREKADALKAIKKLEKEQIDKMYEVENRRHIKIKSIEKTGGYTVTNRFSGAMLTRERKEQRELHSGKKRYCI